MATHFTPRFSRVKVRKNDVDGDFFFLRGRERLRCVRSKIEDVAGFQEGDYARKRHEPTPGGDVLRNQVTCFPHRAPCGIAPALLQTWASYFFTFCTGRRLTVCSLPNAVSKLSFYRFVSTPNPSQTMSQAISHHLSQSSHGRVHPRQGLSMLVPFSKMREIRPMIRPLL